MPALPGGVAPAAHGPGGLGAPHHVGQTQTPAREMPHGANTSSPICTEVPGSPPPCGARCCLPGQGRVGAQMRSSHAVPFPHPGPPAISDTKSCPGPPALGPSCPAWALTSHASHPAPRGPPGVPSPDRGLCCHCWNRTARRPPPCPQHSHTRQGHAHTSHDMHPAPPRQTDRHPIPSNQALGNQEPPKVRGAEAQGCPPSASQLLPWGADPWAGGTAPFPQPTLAPLPSALPPAESSRFQ